jgi:hypothetical protein
VSLAANKPSLPARPIPEELFCSQSWPVFYKAGGTKAI